MDTKNFLIEVVDVDFFDEDDNLVLTEKHIISTDENGRKYWEMCFDDTGRKERIYLDEGEE